MNKYIFFAICSFLVSVFRFYEERISIFLAILVPFVVAYIEAIDRRQLIRVVLVIAFVVILIFIYIIGSIQNDEDIRSLIIDTLTNVEIPVPTLAYSPVPDSLTPPIYGWDNTPTFESNTPVLYPSAPPIYGWDDTSTFEPNTPVLYPSAPPAYEWDNIPTFEPNNTPMDTQFPVEQAAFSNWYYNTATIEDIRIIIEYLNAEVAYDRVGIYGAIEYPVNDTCHYFYHQDSTNIYALSDLVKKIMETNIDYNHCGPYNISYLYWNEQYVIQLSMQYIGED